MTSSRTTSFIVCRQKPQGLGFSATSPSGDVSFLALLADSGALNRKSLQRTLVGYAPIHSRMTAWQYVFCPRMLLFHRTWELYRSRRIPQVNVLFARGLASLPLFTACGVMQLQRSQRRLPRGSISCLGQWTLDGQRGGALEPNRSSWYVPLLNPKPYCSAFELLNTRSRYTPVGA